MKPRFDKLKFKESLNGELVKLNVNDINYEIFHDIVLSIHEVHAFLKRKDVRANHATFVTNAFGKAVVKRSKLRKAHLKNEWKQLKLLNNYQRNVCVSLFLEIKKTDVENLNVKPLRDSKKFWKNFALLFLNNINYKKRITIFKNENIFSNDKKVVETFHEFITNVVKTVIILETPCLIFETSQTNPVPQSIENFSKHPSIKHNE